MKIIVDYDHAAWPAGGHYAYDDDTYDGDPDSHSLIGWGKNPDEAIEELAAQWVSTTGYEDVTSEELDDEEAQALARDDRHTLAFITQLRVFV